MVDNLYDAFLELNFYEYHQLLLDSSYYEVLFPFLLLYALLSSTLGYAKIFQYRSGDKEGQPIKPVIVIVSIVVSLYAVTFEIGEGYSLGWFLMLLFPDISALTIMVLMLYVVGSFIGKDFFRGMFNKRFSSIGVMVIGAIGMLSVAYYLGIAMGWLDYEPLSFFDKWSFIFAVATFGLGVLFIFIEMYSIGVILLMLFAVFMYNNAEGNVLEYFVDPIMFIIVIVIGLLSWLRTPAEKEGYLRYDMNKRRKNLDRYIEENGGKELGPYQSRIYDIVDDLYKAGEKRLEEIDREKNK